MDPFSQKLIESFQLSNKERKLRLLGEVARVKNDGILQFLINSLGDEHWIVRKTAADLLFEYGDEGIPALSAALNSYSEDIQHWALQVLTRLGNKGTPAILRALKSPNHDVRYFACMALGDIREPLAITPLVKALGDERWNVRRAASDALVKFGDDVIPVIDQVMNKSGDEDVRFWAIKSLGKLGAKAQRILLEALRTGPKQLRYVIAAALGESGDKRVIKVLVDSLADPDWTIRKSAMQALAEIGENAVDLLIDALRDPNEDVRDGSLSALFRIGDVGLKKLFEFVETADDNLRYLTRKGMVKLGTKIVDPLVRLFRSGKPEIMVFSAAILGELGSPKAVVVMIEGLTHDSWNVRRSCAYALTEIGEKGVDKIADAMVSQSDDVRYWVTRILESIGEAGMPYLVRALSDKNKNIRFFAAKALGSSTNPEVMRDLTRSLADPSWTVRKAAAESIMKLEGLNIDQLLRAMSNDNEDIRHWVGTILRKTGKEHLEQIHDRIRLGDTELRLCAVQALGIIADPRSTDVLIDALRDGNEWGRIYAAIALGYIGDTRAIIPLIKSLSDRNTEVHRNILRAFEKLGPKVFELIEKSIESKDTMLRRNSAIAIGEMREERGIDLLVMLLEDPEDKVRMAAAEALGQFPGLKAHTILTKALREDSSGGVRHAAMSAIARHAQPDGIMVLIDFLSKTKDERELRITKRNLITMAQRNPDAFLELFKQESMTVKTMAAEALVGVGLPVVPIVTTASESGSEKFVFWCQKVIKKIRNPQEPLPDGRENLP
jgi:HEAT repeat protein